MGVFGRAKERFVVHLRPEDVQAELDQPVDLETVAKALGNLVEWGNLRADPDTGRVTSVEDFRRARFLYQLTPEGEAVEQALAVYARVLGRRAELQSVALADIASQLRALLTIVADGPVPDVGPAHLLLITITERFAGLADNAQAFMASLRRTVDLADGDVDGFLAYKERLIAYLERFIGDLANQGAEIAALAEQVEQAGVEPLLVAVSRREAADAAPGSDETDEAAARAFAEALHRWRQRWQGLRTWFVSADARRQSQAKLLRSAAIAAITQLVNAARSINERRLGRSDRSADFRALAIWFAQAPDDSARHRLWQAAFGLGSARHLSVSAKTLEAWQARPLSASTSWRAAAPVEISPQLRRTGSYERRGQPNRVVDRSTERRLLAERAAAEAAQIAAARARLATGKPILLSALGVLDAAEFRLLLSLLGDALAVRGPGDLVVTTTSSDGTMQLVLRVVPDARPVEVHTVDGVLAGPEHSIEIVDLTGA